MTSLFQEPISTQNLLVSLNAIFQTGLVAFICFLNISALVSLIYRNHRCSNVLTTFVILLVGLAYYCCCIPSLNILLAGSQSSVFPVGHRCQLQDYFITQFGAVLVGQLTLKVLYPYIVPKVPRGVYVTAVTFIVGLLFPLLLCGIATLSWYTPQVQMDSSYTFKRYTLILDSMNSSQMQFRMGLNMCVYKLTEPVIIYQVCQYTLVFLPFAIIILTDACCKIKRMRRKNTWWISTCKELSTQKLPTISSSGCFIISKGVPSGLNFPKQGCQNDCQKDILIRMALCQNFIWFLIFRPLSILHAYHLSSGEQTEGYFLDFGSHLALSFTAIICPFSSTTGLFEHIFLPKQ
ncbi:uncharacterized protein LOC143236272 [Tachypleus tridentatus]|uniref:uncharacterized protein LOC143236272 n=1 Tax=Tachypleus tridentatus TaxID=6853 RepID=UPI003FD14671